MVIDIDSKEVWNQLKQNEQALLIDVRTAEEWEKVGYPDLSFLKKEVLKISFQDQFGYRNEDFIQTLQAFSIEKNQPLYFICLIGGRSKAAASLAYEAGFKHVYNVKDGFEGPADKNGKRGNIAGWLAEGLPYMK